MERPEAAVGCAPLATPACASSEGASGCAFCMSKGARRRHRRDVCTLRAAATRGVHASADHAIAERLGSLEIMVASLVLAAAPAAAGIRATEPAPQEVKPIMVKALPRAEDAPQLLAMTLSPAEDAPMQVDMALSPAEDAPRQLERALPPAEGALPQSEQAPLPAEDAPRQTEMALLAAECAPQQLEKAPFPAEDAPLRSEKLVPPGEDAPQQLEEALPPADDAPQWVERALPPAEDAPQHADDAPQLLAKTLSLSSDFHCGQFNNPNANGALRSINDGARPFYRLAVQQAEATFNIKAEHPIFFEWTQDPVGRAQGFWTDGVRAFFMGVVAYFVAQLFMVLCAAMAFSKLVHGIV